VKVYPGKGKLVFPPTVNPAVERGMRDAFSIFAGMHIQNNWSETTNNILRSVMCLTAITSVDNLRGRVRGLFAIRNDADAIPDEVVSRSHHADIVLNRMFNIKNKATKPDYKIVIHR
jgi:hypothetical protein